MIIAAGSFIVLLLIRFIVLKLLRHWSAKTSTKVDNIIVSSLSTPSVYWCIAISLSVGIALSDIPSRYLRYINLTIDASSSCR